MPRIRRSAATVLVGVAVVTALQGVASPPAQRADSCPAPDLILVDGQFVTMDHEDRIAEAVAIRDGRLVRVGRTPDVVGCAVSTTRQLNLNGRTVLPGLIDVHTHALEWTKGLLRNEIEAGYPAVRTVADITARVRERAAVTPPGHWILGSGWDDAKLRERRYVTRADLDPVSPEHPVYLVHVSGHLAVANSRALHEAGIAGQTPDPAGGVIERGADGEPTGVLKDTAMALAAGRLPRDPPDLAARAARLASERAVEVGLTTLHDVNLSPDDIRGLPGRRSARVASGAGTPRPRCRERGGRREARRPGAPHRVRIRSSEARGREDVRGRRHGRPHDRDLRAPRGRADEPRPARLDLRGHAAGPPGAGRRGVAAHHARDRRSRARPGAGLLRGDAP